MELPLHSMGNLFAQLGLPSDDAAIDGFIVAHGSLSQGVPLASAPFWSPAQARFLREEILEDADWAPVIDQLNTRLRT